MIQCFVKNGYVPIFENNTFPKLLHVCKAEKDDNIFPRIIHQHDDMVEIVFIKEGFGTHTIENKKYETKKGDILIYNKGVLHEERSNPEATISTYVCGFSNLKLSGLEENLLIPNNIEPVIKSGDYFHTIESIFEIMYSEILSGKKGVEETCNYLLLALIKIILRLVDISQNEAEEEEFEIGERIKQYIDDNFLKNLSIKSLSEALGISQYYLIRSFKKKTGYSPMQYIINRKMGEAQNLLINTNYSVKQIASMIGYDNPNYFNMLFTKIIGMSPGKYRKHLVSNSFTKK
ncbi:MAG: AraC family transcriptional regulator [Bacillota bacterium]